MPSLLICDREMYRSLDVNQLIQICYKQLVGLIQMISAAFDVCSHYSYHRITCFHYIFFLLLPSPYSHRHLLPHILCKDYLAVKSPAIIHRGGIVDKSLRSTKVSCTCPDWIEEVTITRRKVRHDESQNEHVCAKKKVQVGSPTSGDSKDTCECGRIKPPIEVKIALAAKRIDVGTLINQINIEVNCSKYM